jgi:3-deoxy-manno-octulosonate cytidylyltransferase (CMP-KDO synthetase)
MSPVTSAGFKVIIPARLASTRLPQKPLLDISGKPLLQHVYEAARKSAASAIIIATDSAEIRERAESFGARVQMTAATHQSGTERLIEVIEKLQEPDDTVIVNLQGDEFNMPPALVDQVAMALIDHPRADMATLCEPITEENDFNNPNIVKVIFDQHHIALDFTRHPVAWFGDAPAPGSGIHGYRHIGIYAYSAGFLRKYAGLKRCAREINERLEQLRVLEYGHRIYVDIAHAQPGLGIDTPEDLEKARRAIDMMTS